MRTIIPVVAAFSLLIVAGPAEASGPTAEWTQWTEKPDWPPRFPDHVTGEMGEVVVDHFGSVHPRTLVDGNCGWPWEIWVTPIPYAPDDVFLSEEVHNGPYGCSSIALNGAGAPARRRRGPRLRDRRLPAPSG